MLNTHQAAPHFTSLNENNKIVSLIDFRDKKNIILYFYPKDDTTGCTIEANQFTSLKEKFSELDTIVIGVSKDDCASHQAFINKFDLKIMLLADTTGGLCDDYKVWQEKEKNGVKKMGIIRSTFIIDKQGKIVDAEYGVSAEGHAQAVLDKLKQI
ncbi:MAG: peroxiredoxin [Gammaproteobacteria bacterium]|nr:peroxiredoxin [Gammaproteobacteria bacterium]